MSDFCKQCSIEHFDQDFRELAELMEPEFYSDRVGAAVICEGCGPTVVDYEGRCICRECPIHGEKDNDEDDF